MAKNVQLPGVGRVVAGDEVDGVIYQRVKVSIGAEGEAADLAFGQAAKAASIPVAIASDQDALPVTGPLTDTQLRATAVPVSDTTAQEALSAINAKITLNTEGRIKVSTMPGIYSLTTGDITANAQTIPIDVDSVSNLMLSCAAQGAVVGHNVSFEGSLDSTNGTDGTWFGLQAARTNANTVATSTGAITGNPGYGWELSVNAIRWFRIRATAHTSGTMRWFMLPGSYATEPIPINQVSTVTANIGTSGITLYTDSSSNLGQNAAFTGTSRDAGSTAAYNLFVANAYADKAGTLYIQKSTDNSTWRTAASKAIAAGESAELIIRVTTRYNRVYFLNGAEAQGAFLLTSAYQRM